MLVVDDLARTLTQAEIPIGIVTALLGAPLFTFLNRCNPGAGVRPDEQLIIAASATLRPPSAALRPAHAGLPAREIWAVLVPMAGEKAPCWIP